MEPDREDPAECFALVQRELTRADIGSCQLGERFWGELVSYKPCRAAAARTRSWRRRCSCERQAAAPTTCRVVAHGAPLNRMLAEPPAQKQRPATAIDAEFSIPFCVAVALGRGALQLDDFDEHPLHDPAVLDLARRVRFVPDPAAGMRDATSGRLEIRTHAGAQHATHIAQPLGHPTRPLSDAALRVKLGACASRARQPLTAARTGELADALMALERAPSARDVLSLLQHRWRERGVPRCSLGALADAEQHATIHGEADRAQQACAE